jgi:hypothetical protein
MVLASGSSGPILTAGAAVGVLMMWPMRTQMQLVRWSAALLYLGLEVVMNRPAYFIISEMDLMGGSTSWYRAQLIRSSFEHIGEWWLVGTDYTRHWMPSGVPASPTQTDITNHYIAMGVIGGLLLMLMFIAIIWKGFWQVGKGLRADSDRGSQFTSWAVGASLFAHAVTCLSVSYYDHSVMFLYLTLAATTATVTGLSVKNVAAVPVPETATAARHLSAFQDRRRRSQVGTVRGKASWSSLRGQPGAPEGAPDRPQPPSSSLPLNRERRIVGRH